MIIRQIDVTSGWNSFAQKSKARTGIYNPVITIAADDLAMQGKGASVFMILIQFIQSCSVCPSWETVSHLRPLWEEVFLGSTVRNAVQIHLYVSSNIPVDKSLHEFIRSHSDQYNLTTDNLKKVTGPRYFSPLTDNLRHRRINSGSSYLTPRRGRYEFWFKQYGVIHNTLTMWN